MTTKKLIERRGYLKNLNTRAHERLRDTLTAEVTLVMESLGDRELTLTVTRAEADALKLAVYAGLEMKMSVVLEVDEKTIRERVEQLEREVCDHRPCVNAAHLFVGTHKRNTQDGMAKGRILGRPRATTGKLSP